MVEPPIPVILQILKPLALPVFLLNELGLSRFDDGS
jgi:hypothetical protein